MVIVNYDSKWPERFLKIKAELQKAITVTSDIQHVGSTSIPGMKAKPIIDIDVELENWGNFEKVKKALASIGYEHEGDKGITGREAFWHCESSVLTAPSFSRNKLKPSMVLENLKAFPISLPSSEVIAA